MSFAWGFGEAGGKLPYETYWGFWWQSPSSPSCVWCCCAQTIHSRYQPDYFALSSKCCLMAMGRYYRTGIPVRGSTPYLLRIIADRQAKKKHSTAKISFPTKRFEQSEIAPVTDSCSFVICSEFIIYTCEAILVNLLKKLEPGC